MPPSEHKVNFSQQAGPGQRASVNSFQTFSLRLHLALS